MDRNDILEQAAKVADDYAEENRRMAEDTIMLDPVLAGRPLTSVNLSRSKSMMIDGCIHSSMMHAAQNIAETIRALKDANTTPPNRTEKA